MHTYSIHIPLLVKTRCRGNSRSPLRNAPTKVERTLQRLIKADVFTTHLHAHRYTDNYSSEEKQRSTHRLSLMQSKISFTPAEKFSLIAKSEAKVMFFSLKFFRL